MDEVPIVTSNPVKIASGSSTLAKTKEKTPGTLANFFLMMPLALIIMGAAFAVGSQIGAYTTFPFHSWQSLVHLSFVTVIVVLVQIFLRSIIYSTLFAMLLVSGIFYGLFGDFFGSISTNFRETLEILRTAWGNKDLPYSILMSAALTGILVVTGAINFFFSLFIKYSFEVVFGRDWGDGRTKAYVFVIVLMIALGAGIRLHSGSVRGEKIIQWEHRSLYKPLEEFCSRIPSGVQTWLDRTYVFDTQGIEVYEQSTGKMIRRKETGSVILTNTWAAVENPVLGTRSGFVAFEHDLLAEIWTSPFPDKLPGFEPPRNEDGTIASAPSPLPMLYRTDLSKEVILVMYDFGYWSGVSAKDGKMLWIKPIDAQSRVNRLFLEEYFRSAWVLPVEDLFVFSCYNGRLTAMKAKTGEQVWEYQHGDNKYAGKGQRALLTKFGERLLATFPSGSVVTLDAKKGTRIGEAKNPQWRPISPAYGQGLEASFVNGEGNLVRFVLDGGKVLMDQPLFVNRPPLNPIPINILGEFAAFKSTLFAISSQTNKIDPVLSFSKQCFATDPVIDGNYVYVGTQDGWVLCLHKASRNEKWRVKLPGELNEEGLFLTDGALLARTRSGGVFSLIKGDPYLR